MLAMRAMQASLAHIQIRAEQKDSNCDIILLFF
jgi:hypothetical protein